MKQYKKLLCATLLTSAVALPAQAEELLNNVYLGLSGGLAIAPDAKTKHPEFGKYTIDFDNGYSFSANAGYRFNEFLRLQADIGYLKNDTSDFIDYKRSSGSVSGTYGVLSVYGDYHFTDKISAFAGIGGGVLTPQVGNITTEEGKSLGFKTKENLVALLKVGTGVSYSVNENIDMIASYDYLRSADFTIQDQPVNSYDDKTHLSAHLVQVGLRYNF
ncbi:outer membrane protein [Pseudovibrio sp. WM33]|uniref:outer membrane protein n=1 Tax=Pseudovibrio sp. WM33 TaxID=1735585 RepID=UPI0007AE9FDD|nr:outer membrane beta-barrel protein [Pseudovibrio sp. WM33]KZL25163.1 OmpA-like transmembrane domain protein [Pseudovibrio sp. WM33]